MPSAEEPPTKKQKSEPVKVTHSGWEPRPDELAKTSPQYAKNIKTVLFTEEQLQKRIRELAAEISQDFNGEPVVVVGLLTGAFMAVADVARHLTLPNTVDFVAASSYGSGTSSSGTVKLKKDLSHDPQGKNIVIVEDLIDTGTTLAWIKNFFLTKKPKCVKVCCILDKPARRNADITVDYVGFECPDEFVVGYGMDFAEDYRTLPFVGVLKEEAYKPGLVKPEEKNSPAQ
eukprot:gnl/TRDRNA2_/TRDRNA2_180278_c0_seq1.p1 gnl/TRDRNA2_/TRDRNA2_180278_c0~~gnl/TRDRNA2_/TRDRNA2_180278_c0_seq1.p1  ORF type:complete len:230 (-),score=59.93 gnl/TRDRNA2_/TRDRNA2_180278_c0_seq1:96-785(-)